MADTYAEVMLKERIRYEAMLPFALCVLGDELVFESEAEMVRAEKAALAAIAQYLASKQGDQHG